MRCPLVYADAMRGLLHASGVLLAWSVLPAQVLADGILRDSFGAASTGRAGASIAMADSGAVLIDNPAAMLALPASGLFEVRLDSYVIDVKYSDPENSSGGPFAPAIIPEFSWIKKSADERLAFGFSVFSPGGFSTDYRMNAPVIGQADYEASLEFLKAMPAIAVRISENWSLGATFGLAYARVELDSPLFVQTGPNAGLPTVMDLEADGFGLSGGLSLHYESGEPGKRLRFGLAYTHGTHISFDGDTHARVFGLGPEVVESRFDTKLEIDFPRSLGVGVAREFGINLVSFDVLVTNWSDAFDDIPIRLDGASNPLFAGETLRDRFPLDWKDGITFRVGLERRVAPGRTLRIGYAYHPNPVPRDTMTPLIPTVLDHVFTAGYSVERGSWTFGVAAEFSGGNSTSVGDSRIVGGEFDESRLDGVAFGFFLSAAYRFE